MIEQTRKAQLVLANCLWSVVVRIFFQAILSFLNAHSDAVKRRLGKNLRCCIVRIIYSTPLVEDESVRRNPKATTRTSQNSASPWSIFRKASNKAP